MAERLVRFPGSSWDEIEGLTDPPGRAIRHAILGLLENPVPAQAAPFPPDGPLPGAYELRVRAGGAIVWYTLTRHAGHEVVNVVCTAGHGTAGHGTADPAG